MSDISLDRKMELKLRGHWEPRQFPIKPMLRKISHELDLTIKILMRMQIFEFSLKASYVTNMGKCLKHKGSGDNTDQYIMSQMMLKILRQIEQIRRHCQGHNGPEG